MVPPALHIAFHCKNDYHDQSSLLFKNHFKLVFLKIVLKSKVLENAIDFYRKVYFFTVNCTICFAFLVWLPAAPVNIPAG